MAVVEISRLRKAFGSLRAVDAVSFTIEAGEVFGLLGPNGAGKSTTINIIATLLRPDSGELRVCGVPISSASEYKRRIGYVPQEISLAERLTGRENLMFFGRLYDLSGAELRSRVASLLKQVGLEDRGDDPVSVYSGGMKRRLNIAAGLLHEPDLLLLDEPTAGVDPQARAYLFEIIERLAESGKAVLYTTHYMEEAQRLCQRTAIIDHGKILAMGTLDELVRGVKSRRDLVVEANELTPDLAGRFAAALGAVPFSLVDATIHLCVEDGRRSLFAAAKAAEELGLAPTAIRLSEPNLETVFLELTGRALRD